MRVRNATAKTLELEIDQHARIGREQVKGMELAEMFACVFRQYFSGEKSQFLSRHLMLETHWVMLQAHDSAMAKLNPQGFDRLFDCSAEIVSHKVRAVQLPSAPTLLMPEPAATQTVARMDSVREFTTDLEPADMLIDRRLAGS